MQYTSYLDILNDEFERRKQVNNTYSLRAFARDLDFSAPSLSQVLSKKQGISIEKAQDIAQRLKLTEEKTQWFCDSVGALHSRSFKDRDNFNKKIQNYKNVSHSFSETELESFKLVTEWQHYALMELMKLREFKNDQAWMAEVLGLRVEEVSDALERMKKLGIVTEVGGLLKEVTEFPQTTQETPTLAVKKFHAQLLKKALVAVYDQEVQEREVSSLILALNTDQVETLKNKIQNLQKDIQMMASQKSEKDKVYCLSMQLFNLATPKA